ncbi:MAG: HAMP domain-containing histidine kinase [Bacteroidia bacterium]|nr:HAMP domain-containing histidine kinase [Bacteroidia bacterium]
MTKKLLSQTSRVYLVFAGLLLIGVAPIFYFVTEKLYLDDADEALILRKNEFLKDHADKLKQSEIPTWNEFNRDIKIFPPRPLTGDVLIYTYYYDSLDAELEPYRELNSPVLIEGNLYTFAARINLVESEDLIMSIALLFFLIFTLLLLGLYLITRRLSQRIWKPFYQTLEQIEKFEINKPGKPIFIETRTEEFVRLNHSIERLIDRNTSIYQNQKEFIENAAHELQTPLAVFQAKIDTLIQSPDVTHEQAEILVSLNESVARLNRLNKNLLLLSKIEKNSFADQTQVSLNGIIEKNLGFFSEQARARNLKVELDFAEILTVNSNPSLVEILVSNLFLNAIRHNIPNGQITIRISRRALIFSNTGEDKALNPEAIFNRFTKSNPAEKGNGLGLAIVKKIAGLNHWKIQYEFSMNLHIFSLLIPEF